MKYLISYYIIFSYGFICILIKVKYVNSSKIENHVKLFCDAGLIFMWKVQIVAAREYSRLPVSAKDSFGGSFRVHRSHPFGIKID